MAQYSKWFVRKGCWWVLAVWLLVSSGAWAQPAPTPGSTVSLVPPAATVPLAGPFTLAFRLKGVALGQHSDFPEIEGFRKASGLVSTTTTRLLPGGKRSTELTVSQRYYCYTEGDYVVPAFDLTVNGQVLHSAATQVRVGTPAATAHGSPAAVGSLDQLLGPPKPQYFYEPPDHAYLALEADHTTVYVGQGVHTSLYLYLQPADQALLSFYDFANQLTTLRQELRQPTTWQTADPDAATLPDTVRRPGQPAYLRFRLADYTYYPLTAQALRFPALTLTLIKSRLLKRPQPGEKERLPIYKTYRAAPLRVAVQPLPPGPAGSTAVAVGEYELRESLSRARPRTGEAFTYTFGVEGAGNPAAVVPSPLRSSATLAVYGPEVREEPLAAGRWRKTFRYRLVAQRPGPVPLGRLLQLPFFNPVSVQYDTLRPAMQVLAWGAAAAGVVRPTDDAFYGPALARADTHLQPLDVYERVSRYAAWLLAGLLLIAAVGWWRSTSP